MYWICLVKGGRDGEGVVSFPELTTEIAKPEKSFRINCPVRSPSLLVLVYHLYWVYDLDQQIWNEVKHDNEDYQGRGVYYSSKPKEQSCETIQFIIFWSKLLMNGGVVVAATQTCKGSPPRMIWSESLNSLESLWKQKKTFQERRNFSVYISQLKLRCKRVLVGWWLLRLS